MPRQAEVVRENTMAYLDLYIMCMFCEWAALTEPGKPKVYEQPEDCYSDPAADRYRPAFEALEQIFCRPVYFGQFTPRYPQPEDCYFPGYQPRRK